MNRNDRIISHLQIIRTWAKVDGESGRGIDPRCCEDIVQWMDEALAMAKDEPIRQGARNPLPVKNKDIPILSRVLYTMQDVKSTERKRQWQQDRLWSMTQKYTGMPGGHGEPKGLDAAFAAISEIEERYAAECARYLYELREAEAVLNAIPNRAMRTFVMMRYVLDMSRKEIMKELNMKRWKYDELCSRIEQSQDMAHVAWPERYILC